KEKRMGRRMKERKKCFVGVLIAGASPPAIMAQEPAKAAFLSIPSNLRFESLETSKQPINSIPPNSRVAAGAPRGRAQCPPRCRGRDRTHVEIYGGYSLLVFDGFRTDNSVINDALRNR